jgi:cytochrome c biogenesis protein CcmG, thiol:disulfide interchange protein DsbE
VSLPKVILFVNFDFICHFLFMQKTGLIILLLLLMMISPAYCQLPAVMLKNLEGESINTDTLNNDGKPFIISFFALWCKPCLRELNAINDIYEDWQKETGVKIVAVSIDEGQNSDKVAPTANGYGWSYEVLLDPNKEFMRAMNVTLIPCLFIIDGKNQVVMRKSSYTDGSEIELIREIRKLLKKE